MIDFNEIIISWVKKFNPTETEKQVAEERMIMCLNCEHYVEIMKKRKWSAICGKCKCTLASKIYTPKTTSCPIGKWVEVDERYGIYSEKKIKKTIL
jgi:hypothetical protein